MDILSGWKMTTVNLRFYGDLNNYLSPLYRKTTIRLLIKQDRTIGAILDILGIPFMDVDLMLANGIPVDFSYVVQVNDRISIYPQFHSIDISPLNLISHTPLH